MANGKRASMREGPLAALFRKTEEAEEASRPRRAERPRRAAAPRAAPSAAAAHPRETGLPHPALGAREPGAAGAESRVPTPAGAPAPRLLLGDPREHDGAPAPARPRRADAAREPAAAHGAPTPVGQPVIRVVGVGGAGVNAVNRMVEAEVEGVEFLAVNTDLQSLQQSTADITLHIGAELTRGLGSGSDAERRPPGGDGGLRPHQGAAQGLGHDLHHRRRRRRHRHRRGARSSRASRAKSAR